MRLRAILFAVVVFAAAGAAAWKLAEAATNWFESATATQLASALEAAGQDWARVETDGLKVTLAGAAPDETSRFRALEIARQVVEPGRITDTTTLKAAAPLPPPAFALELLRNEAEVSLIGLVPETGGRDVIRSALGAGGLSEKVTDMLESADEPAPAGWREALGFGLSVLHELPRAKVSVAPGAVTVIAVTDSDPDRAALEARLAKAAPEDVALTLEISSPRPVIAPFAFAFALDDGAGTLAACSAESAEAADAIIAAARDAGLVEPAECAIGLGAPSPGWVAAVARGIGALKALGGGRFALTDLAAELTAPEGIPVEKLTEVAAALDTALPDVFQLTTVTPPRMETRSDGARVYAPRFEAHLLPDGAVRLSGPVQDATSRAAIESYAAALFGHARVMNATVIDPSLPEGWPRRVLAGVEALATLKEGKLRVTPEEVAVEGWGLDENVAEAVSTLLAAKVGDDALVDVGFNAEAAAALQMAARPRPEICADEIGAILDAGSIQFDAGSATILPVSRGVIAAIADVLRGCPGANFEIGGHTDSQGSAEANQQLSDVRSQAVLAALEAEDLPFVGLSARGFGADDPVADNASESGRAENRRIEFTLVDPEDMREPEEPEEPQATDTAAADCAAAIDAVLAEGSIQFAAGSATIAEESAPAVTVIAAALRGCPAAAFEIGGHTDSQGSDSGNLRLSTERAEAVLAALRAPDLPLPAVTARGYGEADPVADNATAEGRAQNRRIVFTPLGPEPAGEGDAEGAVAAEAGGPEATCAARIEAILAEGSIEFAAESATIAPESAELLTSIAAALRTCPDVAMEIAGHTDSTGSESGNLRLSQERADAVLAALRADDLPLPGLAARGYGEADPVADNGTADGRAANRRIAFSLGTAEGDAGDGSQ
jgi:OmpA-OmpF porin, OOP family